MARKAKEVHSLKGLIASTVRRHRIDFDTLLLILGDEGKGKSTLAFKLGTLIAEALGKEFRAEQMVFATKNLVELATSLSPGSVIVLDEAIDGAFSRDAMTGKNKDFVKFLTICRELNHILIINAPRWGLLDGKVKERAHYAIIVEKRGLAKVHVVYTYDYRKNDPALHDLFRFRFTKADDEEWWRYKQLKRDFVKRREEEDESPRNGARQLAKNGEFVRLVDIAGLSGD